MSEHYFVTADNGHLRVYLERNEPGQRMPGLQQVEAMDFPAGRQSYNARDTAMAGRFQGSKHQAAATGAPGAAVARTGMSIDERLPMQREENRRRVRDVAAEIEAFFASRGGATWDFAGAPEFRSAVVEQLSPKVRTQLRRTISKDLVNQPAEDVRAHFVEAAGRH
ncbi:host attachment protein [Opitutus sp. ER46]|uniref:host attachment protein n=1 Tax=Opitutus sp. ER46 TaxID=2161864 RepID=UPI000D31CAFF|nr:host attachment protein [Opitutus sp. ER46]PTX97809.1 hypothetical protein DB354_05905 [Opitutus sp. ER46]